MMILGALSPSKQRKFPVKSSFGYHLHLLLVIHHCNDWRCRNYHDNTDVKPSHQPGQNVGRARHQGLSRQHSTSNLGDSNASFFFRNIVGWKNKNHYFCSCEIATLPFSTQLVLYSLESWCKRIDCICLSGDNVWQWIQNGKFNLKSADWIRKRKSFLLLMFGFYWLLLLSHAADTEGRDADSLVWLWQASHRF